VFTVAITTVLSVLDGTIMNVALPTIAGNLSVSSSAVVWVVNAFALAQTMLIVPLSTYGDIGGFARIYRTGIVIFIAGSIACALSQSLTMLVAARCFQGIGAAAILATSQPITRFAFPRSQLGIAIGIQSLIVSVSTAAGPAIGGLILTFGTWPLLFWINVPFALLSLALSGKLPDMPRATHRFDWFSAAFSGAALALFITGLDQLRAPANTIFFGIEVAGAFILGTIVVRRQSALEVPFIAIDLLQIRIIRLSLMASFTAFIALNASLIALPFYFHSLGYTAAETGFLMTPFPIGSALVAIIAGRLADRYHAGILGAVGLGIFALSMALLALVPEHPATWDIVWRTALGGAGFALFITPNLRAMVGAAPRHRSGAITGLTTTARMTGMTTGVALAALIFSAGGGVGNGEVRVALWVSVGLSLVAVAISTLRIESVGELRRDRAGPWS
jgi:MFS transporter, DHA2 family, multidrug resistance protein